MPLYGALEGGGTKMVCAVGSGPDSISDLARFPTAEPEATLAQISDFFRQYALAAVGVGTFGPLDLNRASGDYGMLTTTPKPGWQGVNIRTQLAAALQVPVAINTDVNAAALGETWAAGEAVHSLLYITVGTGIGGGLVSAGRIFQGQTHGEIGHMFVPHSGEFAGSCPYHGACLEGLASGPALEARWGQPAQTLGDDHPAWEFEARYLALAIVSCVRMLMPDQVIVGGGVMDQPGLLERVCQQTTALLGGYAMPAGSVADWLHRPRLGSRAGITGALLLAQQMQEHAG